MKLYSELVGVGETIMFSVGRKKGLRTMVSRRDFLRVGSLSVVGLPVAEQMAMAQSRAGSERRSCIFIMMTGGPSQLETFDPKPDAPSGIRGPLRAISTAIPGTLLSEGLPRLAKRADKFAIARSLYHDAAPIHETGMQLLQTGRLVRNGLRYPSFGSVVSRTLGPREQAAPYVVLPRLVNNTGVNVYRGQEAGFLGHDFNPVTPRIEDGVYTAGSNPQAVELSEVTLPVEPEAIRRPYGNTDFGRLLLQARQLVEHGSRCVTVNLFDSLVNQVTWDCHANQPGAPATLYDYRDALCPQFDRAFSALIDDLEQRGLLEETLLVAVGEFGRSPYLNENGGRDHWPGVWSAILAGGGVQGGQVIGASDAHGAAPAERPIHASELTATIYNFLGLELDTVLVTDDGIEIPLVEADSVEELIA